MSKNKLQPIRDQIDAIDLKLLRLIQKRGVLAQKVGEIKGLFENNSSLYRPDREAEILRNLIKLNDGVISDQKIRFIFKEIISACLSLEEQLTVAYLGPPGTHSEAALVKHFGSSVSEDPRPTIEDVFDQVSSGAANFGLVPMENSSEGVVNATLNCLADQNIKICGETYLAIHHQLASGKKFKLADAKVVASHPQALGQCSKWLDANLPHVERRLTSSTAEAAQLVSQEKHSLCIVSSLALSRYNLYQHHHNIEDFSSNKTRFLIIGNTDVEPTSIDKTSFLIQTANKPGALIELLAPFKKRKINLSRIETRPSRAAPDAHNFFIDSDGHQNDAKLKKVIAELKAVSASVRILGSYPSES
ncbi:MAG: prephenate dehydratase [Proteobacteria bacterium]|nr:prephenate dehydratase [Pseudomonadota bacterium]MDA0881028.1 prephenate dehydratase [Pseudomonadota bacterium]MDA1341971.1 prephenate dehydratase [Pseudomonadota bacterium]